MAQHEPRWGERGGGGGGGGRTLVVGCGIGVEELMGASIKAAVMR